MNWSNYSTLKSAGSVSFAKQKQTMREAVAEVKYKKGDDDIPDHKKVGDVKVAAVVKEEREYVAMVSKQWNGATGEALADSSREYSLSDLEREKKRYDHDMARAKAQSDELAKVIADFKKV